jgi:hypothetical protein
MLVVWRHQFQLSRRTLAQGCSNFLLKLVILILV